MTKSLFRQRREELRLSDSVTHAELQAELARLRQAIAILAIRLAPELGTKDGQRILELVTTPAWMAAQKPKRNAG
jgi:hypothetical protein